MPKLQKTKRNVFKQSLRGGAFSAPPKSANDDLTLSYLHRIFSWFKKEERIQGLQHLKTKDKSDIRVHQGRLSLTQPSFVTFKWKEDKAVKSVCCA